MEAPTAGLVGAHDSDWSLGAAAVAGDRGELWVWATDRLGIADADDRARLLTARLDDLGEWRVAGEVTYAPSADELPFDVARPWMPGAALYDEGLGAWRAWFLGREGDGPPMVVGAASDDGLHWRIATTPQLRAPNEGWDSSGIRVTAVQRMTDGFLMTYNAALTEGPQGVGLAISSDGATWRLHADNPVFTGADAFFDDHGISDASAHWRDDRLRIFYTGRADDSRRCDGFGSPVRATAAFVELFPPTR